MTCKDCVHFEVCANVYCEVTAETEIKNTHNKPCFYFKDKSKYIELPCKVGDTVYEVGTDLKIYQNEIKNIIYDTNGIAFDERAINETVFLTKSEAEQKLKELQND